MYPHYQNIPKKIKLSESYSKPLENSFIFSTNLLYFRLWFYVYSLVFQIIGVISIPKGDGEIEFFFLTFYWFLVDFPSCIQIPVISRPLASVLCSCNLSSPKPKFKRSKKKKIKPTTKTQNKKTLKKKSQCGSCSVLQWVTQCTL